MEQIITLKDGLTIPQLPCINIEETVVFWEAMGYTTTYKMTRPYQYGVVERNGYAIHFGRVKGMDAASNLYSGCLVLVCDVAAVYKEFSQRLKKHLGRVPHSGIPRISGMKPGATRFTLTDVSGNSIIFVQYGEQDDETYQKADDKLQTPLQRSIAIAIRFRDYKEDAKAAAKTLDAALQKSREEAPADVAEALAIRIDLAHAANESRREAECRQLLAQVDLPVPEKRRIAGKHQVQL